MDLHATDYITYYNVHSVRFTSNLFHKMYILNKFKDPNLMTYINSQIFNDLLNNEGFEVSNSVFIYGSFLVRMQALHHLGTKIECAEWFKPNMQAMINGRSPYLAAAAVEPMEFELIDGYPDLAFNPDRFRSRLKEIETSWDIVPDIARSAS